MLFTEYVIKTSLVILKNMLKSSQLFLTFFGYFKKYFKVSGGNIRCGWSNMTDISDIAIWKTIGVLPMPIFKTLVNIWSIY